MDNEKPRMEMIERRLLLVNGVDSVDAFDENKVQLKTSLGMLAVKGKNLAIKTLDLEAGKVDLEGEIDALEYLEDKGAKARAKGKSVLSRLIR